MILVPYRTKSIRGMPAGRTLLDEFLVDELQMDAAEFRKGGKMRKYKLALLRVRVLTRRFSLMVPNFSVGGGDGVRYGGCQYVSFLSLLLG